MKKILSITLLILSFSCGPSRKYVCLDNKKLSKEMISFLNEFEQASANHDSGKLIELLDSEYRKVQLFELHDGNIDRFLNELFCGSFISEAGFKCLKYNSIKEINFVRAENIKEGYTVYYKVSDGNYEVICSLVVTVKTSNKKTTFGIYGALG